MLKKIDHIRKIYFSKKLSFVFLMGIASGIPLYLILSTLVIWLTREEIDIATIGLFSLTQLPWSLKFIWAPLIDNMKITQSKTKKMVAKLTVEVKESDYLDNRSL